MRNLIMILLLLGSYPTYAETTIVRFFVNGEAHTPVVSITETPHSVKVSIKNNIYKNHCNKDNDKRDNRSIFKL